MTNRFAGFELGGTKSIAVLWDKDAIAERVTVPTTTPAATLPALRAALDRWVGDAAVAGLGIASFGPVRLDPAASDFGTILATPKPGWAGTALRDALAAGIAAPVAIDTDVNAAALAEHAWGAGQGCASLAYLTIGTGVGGGLVLAGRPVHGRLHPEVGHILPRRAPGDGFVGICPFHGDCVEGLVSGPALARRFGMPAAAAPADHPSWAFVAHDLAQLFAILIHLVAPQRILVGGGVGLGVAGLIDHAVALVPPLLGGFYPDLDRAALARMIGPAGLGQDAGPLGAIALARLAAGQTLER